MEGAARRRIEWIRHFTADRGARHAGHRQIGYRGQQHARVRMLWRGEQLPCPRELDDAAEIHDADAIGDVVNHGEVVRDEEIGQPQLVLQTAHQVQHLGLDRDVERGRRLVADQKSRVGRQRAGDGNALSLTTRKLVRIFRPIGAGKADLLQERDDFRRQFRWRLGESMSADRLGDDVLDPPARIEARVGILKDHLHGPPQRELRIGEVDQAAGVADFAARGAVQADDEPRHGRLAAAGFAHQAQRLAFFNGEAHAVDGAQNLPRLALDHAVEPRRGDIEIACDVDQLDEGNADCTLERPCAVAHGTGTTSHACSQHAASVLPAGNRSGRSRRQRSNTRGQRGLNAHPLGIAVRRGIVPSICASSSRSATIDGIDPIKPAV